MQTKINVCVTTHNSRSIDACGGGARIVKVDEVRQHLRCDGICEVFAAANERRGGGIGGLGGWVGGLVRSPNSWPNEDNNFIRKTLDPVRGRRHYVVHDGEEKIPTTSRGLPPTVDVG